MAGLPIRGLRKTIYNKALNHYTLLRQVMVIALFFFIICFSFQFKAFSQINPEKSLKSESITSSIQAQNDEDFTIVLVRMNGNYRIEQFYGNRPNVLSHMSIQAKNFQKKLVQFLEQGKQDGSVQAYHQFWIINAVLVHAHKTLIQQIEQRADVLAVQDNYSLNLPEPEALTPSIAADTPCEWGIEKIMADRVWETYGLYGSNIRIGHLDTGVDGTHPDLSGKISRFAVIDPYGSMIDADQTAPYDSSNHGTHTAGTMVGGNAGGTHIGVAPDAELLSAMVLNGGSGTFAQVLGGIEWVIDPDGNPHTDDGADVVNLSLGANGKYEDFIEPVESLVAADIFPVFSIGNSGPNTSSSPGNAPNGFGVGAVDANSSVAYFSSGEKIEWNYPPYVGVWVKPDICAPGVSIKSSVPGGYSWLSGTSMASPHIAGVVALIRQANPDLTVEQIKTILSITALDLGDESKDTRYGWGLVNAYDAVSIAVSGDVPDELEEYDPDKAWAYIISPKSDQSL
ncbi:MAG: S8 family serine peptidase, partial [Elusimicrobia bacterium]|nr:S8 family serine peptidase [Elusimicrobiota bacterium]MBD3411701.1 S8 family serine peptidase [Elusimicrobiota bacterium]